MRLCVHITSERKEGKGKQKKKTRKEIYAERS